MQNKRNHNHYYFLQSRAKAVFQIIGEAFPQIFKAISITESPSDGGMVAHITQFDCRDNPEAEQMNIEGKRIIIASEQQKKSNYEWLSSDNLIFHIQEKKEVQLDVFNELKNNILLLRLGGNQSGRKDLLYLFFHSSKSGTKQATALLPQSAHERDLLAITIHRMLSVILSNMKKESLLFKQHQLMASAISTQLDSAKSDIQTEKERYQISIQENARHYLRALSSEYDCYFKLSADALEKIAHFKGLPEQLYSMLDKAASYAYSFSQDCGNDIIIHDSIIINETNTSPKEITENNINHRHTKLHQFLDNLEHATGLLHANRQKITGTTVGKALDMPVTAPAITLNLKKNASKIRELMHQYPNRWTLLRTEFRPVMNIVESQNKAVG